MKISEMSMEELQDYALGLEEKNKALEDDKEVQATKLAELQDLNTKLQQRNNQLFMQVESGVSVPTPKEPEPVPTCEEFAKTLKGALNK